MKGSTTRECTARKLCRRLLVPRHRRRQAPPRRVDRRGGRPHLGDRPRPVCDGRPRPYGRRTGHSRADVPPARQHPQGRRQAPRRGQGRALRTVRAHRRDAARLAGRHRRRHRHGVQLRQQGHPRAAQRHRDPRRRDRAARQDRRVPRPAPLHLAARRRRADQRLQLPGLGHAREARPGLPRRAPDDRQARQPDGLPDRGRRAPHHRVRPDARGLAAAAVRQPRRPARPARRAGLHRVHRLGQHRRDAAPAPLGAARRRAARRRGRLAQLLDPRPRRHDATTPSSTCTSRVSSRR